MKKYCIISHTHWDREWYVPYEVFRLKLVDLIDNVLECIENDERYIFHMDAQTIVLDDYLQIRPEKREIIKKRIENGNLIIGPWYVQNDFYLSSAESTVRNLIIGIKSATEWGESFFVGYTPDQFGLPAQLPQILNGFEIFHHIFGRGDSNYNLKTMEKIPHPSEAYWESPDGSRVLSIHLPYWYNNLQRLPEDTDKAIKMIEEAAANLDNWKESPYYLMMNGVDHLEPQENLLEILDKVNQKLDDAVAVQTTMKDYLKMARLYVSDIVKFGEFRRGTELEILTGTFSTRTDVKKLNFEIQKSLIEVTEPLYAMITMLGAGKMYPQAVIEYALKLMISNHAHDSICCCSHNHVMRHMKDRMLSVTEISNDLIERGMKFINHHIERKKSDFNKYYLTVMNTSQSDYTGVIDVFVDIAKDQNIKSFVILNSDGNEIPYHILSKSEIEKECISPLNLPGLIDVDRYSIEMYIENLKGFSYENFVIKKGKSCLIPKEKKLLENDYIKFEIEDGKVNMVDKVKNIRYDDIVYFDDVGDCGDSYVFMPVDNDKPIRTSEPEIEVLSCSPLKSSIKLTYKLEIPETSKKEGRSQKKNISTIECVISLAEGERHATFDIEIDNNSVYHLLRCVVNTGIKNDITYASTIFDIANRDRSKIIHEINNGTQPVNEYVYIKDEHKKIAVFTAGLYEYEHLEGGRIALSLLRSVDRITFNHTAQNGIWDSSENVMIGKTSLKFAVMPYFESDEIVPMYEKNVSVKPIHFFDSVDKKLYLGGKPTVQGSDVKEVYEKKDKFENIILPHKKQILDIGNSVVVSAFKKAEFDNDVVLRVFNPFNDTKEINLEGFDVEEVNFIENSGEAFSAKVEKKKIKTYKIKV